MSQSYLFVPANSERVLLRAQDRGADYLIVDLEDAVPETEKPQARAALAAHLARFAESSCQVIVRVNADLCSMAADLEAIKDAPLLGLMIPKVQDAGQMRWIAESLTHMGRADLSLIALIECAQGLLNAQRIASVAQVHALALGPEDFSRALNHASSPEGLLAPAQQLIWAARAQGKQAIACPDSIAVVQDEFRIQSALTKAKAIGSDGILCIHPKQVALVQQVFEPTNEEVKYAREVIACFDKSVAEGKGVLMLNGEMIDLPVVNRARALIRSQDRRKTRS